MHWLEDRPSSVSELSIGRQVTRQNVRRCLDGLSSVPDLESLQTTHSGRCAHCRSSHPRPTRRAPARDAVNREDLQATRSCLSQPLIFRLNAADAGPRVGCSPGRCISPWIASPPCSSSHAWPVERSLANSTMMLGVLPRHAGFGSFRSASHGPLSASYRHLSTSLPRLVPLLISAEDFSKMPKVCASSLSGRPSSPFSRAASH